MKTNRSTLFIAFAVAILAIAVAFPGQSAGQTAATKSSGGQGASAAHWSIQVDAIEPGNVDLASSFQAAIYENLLDELRKTGQFEQVFRDGDRGARDIPNLLVLKTVVEKYTAGSETRRAVTTVSGATKLTVQSQLVTRDGKVVFEHTVNGDVRFFGSNLRATHNLAHNIAKTVQKSSWSVSEQRAAVQTGQL